MLITQEIFEAFLKCRTKSHLIGHGVAIEGAAACAPRCINDRRPSGHVLADAPIDAVTTEMISGFVAKQRNAEYQTSSINRALQVLRRRLAVEWGHAEKAVSPISLLPGERRRERVLSSTEEAVYLKAAQAIGERILERYSLALDGIRATQRGKHPIKPKDPFLLRDVATVLLDCGLRPEECYRLRCDEIRDGAFHIPFGKTASARRSIPFPNRAAALLEMRKSVAISEWVFPASTKSGRIGQSSLKKRHAKACALPASNTCRRIRSGTPA